MAARASEQRRLREVRKYHVRSTTRPGAAGQEPVLAEAPVVVSNPDTTLTALMQLIACRLGSQRAIVSIVEEHAQYFLAESTRSLNLGDFSQHDEGDGLWMGCGWTKRSEALCATTVDQFSASRRHPDEYTCFSVCDLPKDQRFCDLPYVTGSPHFRYYAGTPLLTQQNIPIGSVFVIDDRPRDPPSKFEVDFLGIMARNVMTYLEMRRESERRLRNEHMIKCLAAFVEGETTESDAVVRANFEVDTLPLENENNDTKPTSVKTLIETQKCLGMPAASTSEDSDHSVLSRSDQPPRRGAPNLHKARLGLAEEIPTQQKILSRAAKLLRESFNVDYTMFVNLDITTNTSATDEISADSIEDLDANHEGSESETASQPDGSYAPAVRSSLQRPRISQNSKSSVSGVAAKVLSFASASASSYDGDELRSSLDFTALNRISLRRLMTRYPEGKLWVFDDSGVEVSSDDEFEADSSSPAASDVPGNPPSNATDVNSLAKSFLGVRQLIFAPLWDVETTHIAVCFAVSLKPSPVLNSEGDRAFMRAFLNSVSITCSRARIKAANRQKGDFISSISHELRSPLHGILASAELMTESTLDSAQTEYCNTITICGQSLLETITDILEYTKINSLLKHARVAETTKRHEDRRQSKGIKLPVQPQTDSVGMSFVDVAKVCEDTVIAISATYMYHTSSSDQLHYRVLRNPEAVYSVDLPIKSQPVVVVVDIPPGCWEFVGLSGSIHRIIMNLVGNSLKYTHSGFVKVGLSQQQLQVPDGSSLDTSMIQIRVTDTGKGISEDFLRNKLFSPFSQESILAPGTGLGLNIVHSLVQLEKGSIDVTSEVGVGTSVIVSLPLQRFSSEENPDGIRGDFLAMAGEHAKTTFSFQGPWSTNSQQLKKSIRQYLTEWFEFEETSSTTGSNGTILVVSEEECSNWIIASRREQNIIVVCAQSSQQQLLQKYSRYVTSFELLTTPFGPNKLSKVVAACLEHSSRTSGLSPTVDATAKIDHESEFPPPLHIRNKNEIPDSEVPRQKISPTLSQLPENREPVKYPRNRTRVLCVDDNVINLRLLQAYMSKLGVHDISCAENGIEAFEAVRLSRERFDLILMDLSMPICDGFQSTSLIRDLEKLQLKFSMPNISPLSPALIVAVTGLASQRDQDAAKVAGVDHFLSKPLTLSRLKECLIEWGVLD